MAEIDPAVRSECPNCCFMGPHYVMYTDSNDVVIDCGQCGFMYGAEPGPDGPDPAFAYYYAD